MNKFEQIMDKLGFDARQESWFDEEGVEGTSVIRDRAEPNILKMT